MKCPYCIKKCSCCGRILVANSINFTTAKTGKYGLRNDCKICRKEKRKKHYENNKEKFLKQTEEYKKAHKDESSKKQKEYSKRYYDKNKESFKERNKSYYESHKEEVKERRRNFYKDNKEHCKEINKQWCENNPDKVFNICQRRREKESQGNGITKDQWLEMMNFFDWKCAYSGISLSKDNRSLDHIIPLSKNGENEIWNLVPMLLNYNSSKNTKDMLEWYLQQDFYSEERLNKIYEWIEYAKNKYQSN